MFLIKTKPISGPTAFLKKVELSFSPSFSQKSTVEIIILDPLKLAVSIEIVNRIISRIMNGNRRPTAVEIQNYTNKMRLRAGMEEKLEGGDIPEVEIEEFLTGTESGIRTARTNGRNNQSWHDSHQPIIRSRNNRSGG